MLVNFFMVYIFVEEGWSLHENNKRFAPRENFPLHGYAYSEICKQNLNAETNQGMHQIVAQG